MKLILSAIFLILPFYDNGRGLLIKDDLVMLLIDQNSTVSELYDYKIKLKEDFNIDINFELTYDDQKRLKKIDLKVDCNDGFKGSLKTRLMDNNHNIGFYRIFNDKYETPFAIGNLPEIYDLK